MGHQKQDPQLPHWQLVQQVGDALFYLRFIHPGPPFLWMALR